ncbi:MAG: hypothetical protein ACD_21C00162G0003 [uncultured bacterium]|nr:MAG: hypothetical protein ACD_21C00162G0003 [uncultured bacterium]
MLTKIRNSALNLLAQREHTQLELQRKLIAKGFAVDDVIKAIHELEKQGLQSNERFTESYIAMRTKRGFGPIRIKMELYERGVEQELIERFLLGYKSAWPELAEKARCKKFGKKIPNDLSEQAKQMRYLYHKGFDTDLIRRILRSEFET